MSIPGSPNLLLMRQAVDAAPTDFQLPASCRFNSADTTSLKRTLPVAGNRTTWTWSAWVKRSELGNHQNLFSVFTGATDNTGYIDCNFQPSDQLQISGWTVVYLRTTAVYKDTSAFYHVVCAVDLTNSIASERVKFYVSGVRVTDFELENQPAQNTEWPINDVGAQGKHGIANNVYYTTTNQKLNGYLSDVQFVDGMVLSPSCWGGFSLTTGDWNPKEFGLQVPNNGTTWSGNLSTKSGSFHNNHPATYAFDGVLTNFAGESQNGAGNGIVFTPAAAFENVTSFRYRAESVGANMQFKIYDGTSWTALHYDSETVWNGSNTAWRDASKFIPKNRQIKQFEYLSLAGGHAFLGAIEINGVLLIDDKTDNSASINDGRVWSTYMSATGGWLTTNTPDRTFNGAIPNMGNSGVSTYGNDVGGTITFAPTGGIVYKDKVELYTDAGHNYTINGGSSQSFGPASGQSNGTWYTVATGSGTLNTLTWTPQNSGSYRPSSAAMRIDGQLMIDGVQSIYGRNGYKLLSNGFSASRAADIGKDYANGLIATANGGKPILVTTSSYGESTGGTVNTTDNDPSGSSVKSSIVFALSGYTIADVHHTVKGSGSAKAITNNGSAALSEVESRLYGKSIRFNGGQRLSCGSDTDFALGGGDWCIEFWMYADDISGTEILLENDTGTGGISIQKNGNDIEVQMGSLFDPGTTLGAKQWYHICVNRHSSTTTLFIDGVSQGTTATDAGTSQAGFEIGQRSDGSNSFSGYLQDIRVYKAESKYGTSNFTPPIRNDYTAENLEVSDSGVVYSKSTSGGAVHGSYPMTQSFDGKITTTGVRAVSGGGFIFQPSSGISHTNSIEVHSGITGVGTQQCKINDGTAVDVAQNVWVTVKSGSGTLTKLEMTAGSTGNANIYLGAVRIDGSILVDPFFGDIFSDSSTSYGTGTSGGDVRGNFPTWNPLAENAPGKLAFSNGNLDLTQAVNYGGGTVATMGASTGKFYWELTVHDTDGNRPIHGIVPAAYGTQSPGEGGANAVGYRATGKKRINTSGSSEQNYGDAWADGDIIGCALDATNGAVYFSRNGTWQASGVPTSGASRTNACHTWTGGSELMMPAEAEEGTTNTSINFGQRKFIYTPPTGFVPLCSQNLSTPTIANSKDHFDTAIWTGNDATRDINTNFQPDLVWIKNRADDANHMLFDAKRGAQNVIYPNTTTQETAASTSLTHFLSNGFTLGTANEVNGNGDGIVAWNWHAPTAFSNSAGTNGATVASTGRYNADAGFAIVEYTGGGYAAGTGVYHPLASVPKLIIHKRTDGTSNWEVYTTEIDGSYDQLLLNEQDDKVDSAQTAPTSTLFNSTWSSGQESIAYLWAPVAGYSAFGKYVGNGESEEGPLVNTGFRVRYLLLKGNIDGEDWIVIDSGRTPFNDGSPNTLFTNTDEDELEIGTYNLNLLSNGFKIRNNNPRFNTSGSTYIYAAFGQPLKTARAR